MRKRLTVAHYKEDLNWLSKINSDIKIYIYHKEDNQLNYDEKIVVNENEFILRNVGREAHTYIKHIIDNYDDLYDLEFFTQGHPEHASNWIDVINNEDIIEYKQYSSYFMTFLSTNGEIDENSDHRGKGTRKIWDNLFPYNPPSEVIVIPHAYIKVDRETIRMHSLDFYKKCLDYFNDNLPWNTNAWTFENLWALIFHDIHREKNQKPN